MALMKCSECGKEVSSQAHACPNCGHPIRPVVIEQTAKSWKLAKLISWLVVIVGIFTLPYGGLPLISWGLIAVIVCKFGIYWNHK